MFIRVSSAMMCAMLVFLASTFHPAHADPVPGQITVAEISAIHSRNGMMIIEVVHDGSVPGGPEGPGLVHAWVNGFTATSAPGSCHLRVLLPAWSLPRPPGAALIVKAWQDRTFATLTREYSAQEVQRLLSSSESLPDFREARR